MTGGNTDEEYPHECPLDAIKLEFKTHTILADELVAAYKATIPHWRARIRELKREAVLIRQRHELEHIGHLDEHPIPTIDSNWPDIVRWARWVAAKDKSQRYERGQAQHSLDAHLCELRIAKRMTQMVRHPKVTPCPSDTWAREQIARVKRLVGIWEGW